VLVGGNEEVQEDRDDEERRGSEKKRAVEEGGEGKKSIELVRSQSRHPRALPRQYARTVPARTLINNSRQRTVRLSDHLRPLA
jgi:hypothetical protein